MADNRPYRKDSNSHRSAESRGGRGHGGNGGHSGQGNRGGDRYRSNDGERRYGRRNDDGEQRRYGHTEGRDGQRRFERRDDRRSDSRRGESRDGERRYERRDGERRYERRNEEAGARRYAGGERDSRGAKGNTGGKRHAQRGGKGRDFNQNGPQRAGYREERIQRRQNEPDLPSDLDIKDLDPLVLQDLKVLSNDNAEAVAKHLLMAAMWMADDPQLALRHARAAKDRAGRVAVVRETAGIAAYHAGEWKEALSELRAARRMSGGPGLLAVMADCERGLGRPEKAIEISKEFEPCQLDAETRVELAIVVAGARSDLGQLDTAVTTLLQAHPNPKKKTPTMARLSYAYADALASAGRLEEAREWFGHAKEQDVEGWLDAEDRLAELG